MNQGYDFNPCYQIPFGFILWYTYWFVEKTLSTSVPYKGHPKKVQWRTLRSPHRVCCKTRIVHAPIHQMIPCYHSHYFIITNSHVPHLRGISLFPIRGAPIRVLLLVRNPFYSCHWRFLLSAFIASWLLGRRDSWVADKKGVKVIRH